MAVAEFIGALSLVLISFVATLLRLLKFHQLLNSPESSSMQAASGCECQQLYRLIYASSSEAESLSTERL